VIAQDEPEPTPEPTPEATPAPPGGGGGGGGRGGGGNGQGPQPYDRVVTKDAKTSKGVFTVHVVRDRYYYEIPKKELDKDFLWNSQIAKTGSGAGYAGMQVGDRVVRWTLKGNRVLLLDVHSGLIADPKQPIALAVQAASSDSIIQAFPVAAFSKEQDPVIEVTRLFTGDIQEFSARQSLNAQGVDQSRSFIEHVTPFPNNVEAEVTLTYTRGGGGRGGGADTGGGGRGGGRGAVTVVLHHSMMKLPETPMKPRLYDARVGYFSSSALDYTRDEYKAERIRYIDRWRLEKKDPTAAVSEPVKPIVYYIDPSTPTNLVPWIKKGVEAWQPAFEGAGFKNAIQAKSPPTSKEDPNWSVEDASNSVIKWIPSTTENAEGPHISDPRTGEILNADIEIYNNVLNLARDWYFVQVGPLDPRAQKLPLPDDLMGRLIEFVVTHEVGHTLGLEHNMKASSMYPQDKIRDKDWVHTMGHTPSIMDYSRFNYVAQPEDHIAMEDLVPRIGPYDLWAIKWGYSPIPDAKTADQEKPTLNKWAKEQDDKPYLRFDTAASGGSDPGEETEAVGDADAIKSTALGVKNLQLVAKMLMSATAYKDGDTYEQLSELYGRMITQWTNEMNHVAGIVGGFNSQEKVVGQEGRIFSPIPKEEQQAAVKFLIDNAFATPLWMIDEDILRRIEVVGAIERVHAAQSRILSTLLNSGRFGRLMEQETLDGPLAYSAVEFLTTMRKGIWKELDSAQVKIDPYRRELQRTYLQTLNNKLNPPAAGAGPGGNNGPTGEDTGRPPRAVTSGDERPLYRAELRTLNASIAAAILKTTDRETKAHLEAAKDEITRILDPLPTTRVAAASGGGGGRGGSPLR
jgi:hypothetical protein